MSGRGHLLRGRAAARPGAVQGPERRAGEAMAGDHGKEGRARGCQGLGRQAGQIEAAGEVSGSRRRGARGPATGMPVARRAWPRAILRLSREDGAENAALSFARERHGYRSAWSTDRYGPEASA